MSAAPDPVVPDAVETPEQAGDAVGAGAAALNVTQLLVLLDDAVRSAGLVELWVSGTVTGLRPGPRFTTLELVDYEADGSTVQSVLSVGMFASHARQIRRTLAMAGTELADGLQVALWGPLDLNPRYGRLRLLAQRVDPRTTVGAAVLARDELVAELDRSGRLRAQAALSVPVTPRRIGLISSPTAAGRADVFEVLERTPVPVEIVEAQAAMSGPAAPVEVARAIGLLAGAGVDVVLIARGGGAKSDWRRGRAVRWPWPSPAVPCLCGRRWATPPTTPSPTAWPTPATRPPRRQRRPSWPGPKRRCGRPRRKFSAGATSWSWPPPGPGPGAPWWSRPSSSSLPCCCS